MASGRLLNFVSEQEVEDIKKKRTDRGEAESTAPERPLYEILKQNKDKQQAEFNERFKHQPPKALDEDETEFLEKLDNYKKEQELLVASEEAQQLLRFQLAVSNRTTAAKDAKPSFNQNKLEPLPQKERKPEPLKSTFSTIRIKPLLKKAKIDNDTVSQRVPESEEAKSGAAKSEQEIGCSKVMSLVAYETDSEDDD